MKKRNRMNRVIILVLVAITLFNTFLGAASAASTTGFDKVSTSRYAKTYTLATSGRVIPYTSKYLSTRGTVSYGASSRSYIDCRTDELYVFDVGKTNGKYWAYVSYPSGARRVNAYIPLSAITSNNGSHVTTTSTGKFYCSIRSNTGNSRSYYVDKGDAVTLIATTGTKCQIMYPTSGGKYRIAWCNKTDYNTYCEPKITLNRSSLTLNGVNSYRYLSVSGVSRFVQGAIVWTSSNTNVARVSPSGVVTAVGNGTAYITATIAGTSCKATATVTVTGCGNTFISASQIASAAAKYGISTSSNAYKALQSINTKYANYFTTAQKNGTLVFMFEGVGSDSNAWKRMNAMCVVVKAGKIVYVNMNCSTIPDYPFNPSKNDGTAMPTIKSGIYNFTTVNHRGSYAALNVSNASVVRFSHRGSFYNSTSYAINVHRRSSDSIAASKATWVNSAGCLLVGRTGTGAYSEYAKFIQTVGIVRSGAVATAKYSTYVTGKIIVDRSYAYTYLRNVGYSDAAIKAIGY